MLTIHLNNLKFHAYHGLFEAEQILGNDFEVNIFIEQKFVNSKIDQISQTIDYSKVYALVRERMQHPTPLLETVAQDICAKILADFELAYKVHFSIKKLNPPITQFMGSVGISFELSRE